jgi:toxin ParE1/3/4
VARQRPATADEVLRRIDRQCRSIADNPAMGRERPDVRAGIRSFPVDRWLVLYRVDPEAVVISRVVDGARDIPAIRLPRR